MNVTSVTNDGSTLLVTMASGFANQELWGSEASISENVGFAGSHPDALFRCRNVSTTVARILARSGGGDLNLADAGTSVKILWFAFGAQ
jgi:hypothetical protein